MKRKVTVSVLDREGVIPAAKLRALFERSVAGTTYFKDALPPLNWMDNKGHGGSYEDAETDALWIGFAIGMRCAERMLKACEFPES